MKTAEIIDLALVADAQRYLEKMLKAKGLAWFLRQDARRPFQLEPTRVELVLRTAARSREKPHRRAVDYARKQVRRTLIRHVVAEMLQTGL